MANSFLDQLMGGGYAPSLGDLWGGPRAGASNSLNDLFGSPGGLAPSLSSLLGGVAPGPLAPSLGDLFGGVNPGAPSMAAGFAEIKAQQAAKEKALTAPQANANQPGTVNPQNPTSAPRAGAPSTSNYAFAQQHMPLAMQAIKTAGVDLDPAIPVAVAANETGWGQAAQGGQQWNSFHGIRGQGSAGQTPGGFQAYATPQESYDAFVRLVTDPNGRYAPAYQAYQQSRDPRQFIQDIANAGYALAGQEADAWIPQVQGILPQVQAAWQSQPPSGAVQPIPNVVPAGSGTVGGQPWRIAFDFNQPYTTPLPSGIGVHRGVDLVIPGAPNNGRGAPYTAFVPGVVTNITQDSAGGQGIIVQSADGLYQRYFHNDRVLVKVGDEVGPGRPPIGIVGASGTEGFPHLHFEVSRRVNGDPVDQLIDPRPYLQGAAR